MKPLTSLFVLLMMVAPTALAQPVTPSQAERSAQTMTEMVDGEVRKVDKDARKLTLRHGEIKQLDMPAMTMVFRVKEPSMLDRVKAGDKIKFKAEGTGGALTITEIETK